MGKLINGLAMFALSLGAIVLVLIGHRRFRFPRFLFLATFALLLLMGRCSAQDSLTQRVDRLATAIARTEGFFVKGTIPNRYHNPGDIRSTKQHAYAGQIGLNKKGYVIFKTDTWGWIALKMQILRVINDDSAFYNRNMTFAQIAKIYAESPQWPKTLCKILQINPRLTFNEYFDLAPRVLMTGVQNETLLRLFEGRGYDLPDLWSVSPLLAQVY